MLTLLFALVVIHAALALPMRDYQVKTVWGSVGVLSGSAEAYLLRQADNDLWVAAAIATIVATILSLVAYRRRTERARMFIFAWFIGVFGAAVAWLASLRGTLELQAENFPWGAILVTTIVIALAGFVIWRSQTADD